MESAVWKYTMKYEVHGTWKESGDFKVSLLIPKKKLMYGIHNCFHKSTIIFPGPQYSYFFSDLSLNIFLKYSYLSRSA